MTEDKGEVLLSPIRRILVWVYCLLVEIGRGNNEEVDFWLGRIEEDLILARKQLKDERR